MGAIDHNTVLSDSQAVTASAASSVYNRGAAGRELAQPMTFEMLVKTTCLATGGASNLTLKLQGSVDEAFSSPVDLIATEAIAKASLVAGYRRRLTIPAGTAYQWIRGYYTVDTNNLTSGAISLYPVQTPDQRP